MRAAILPEEFSHLKRRGMKNYDRERAFQLHWQRIMRLTRQSVLVAAATVVFLFSLRFVILVLEAYTMISNERRSDDDLVELCTSGKAQGSAHMRQACMNATVDRASPAIARALTNGAYNLVAEIAAMAAFPLQSSAMTGVVVMSVLPWLSAIKSFFTPSRLQQTGDHEHRVFILHNGDRADPEDRAGLRPRHRALPPSVLVEEEWGDVELEAPAAQSGVRAWPALGWGRAETAALNKKHL